MPAKTAFYTPLGYQGKVAVCALRQRSAARNAGMRGHGDTARSRMVDQTTMTRLESLKGAKFDTPWLQSMVHDRGGAIVMVQTNLGDGEDTGAVTMARTSSQQSGIDQMTTMLGG